MKSTEVTPLTFRRVILSLTCIIIALGLLTACGDAPVESGATPSGTVSTSPATVIVSIAPTLPPIMPPRDSTPTISFGGRISTPTEIAIVATSTPRPIPITIKVFGMSGKAPTLVEARIDGTSSIRYDEDSSSSPPVLTISSQQLSDDLVITDNKSSTVEGLLSGDYIVRVEYPPYEQAEQKFTVQDTGKSTARQIISVTLSMDPPDVEALINVGKGLMDYRTGKIEIFGGFSGYRSKPDFRFLNNDFLTNGPRYVSTYPDGQPTGEIAFSNGDDLPKEVSFSPDFKKVIYKLDHDFWIAEVDWNSNRVQNERQLTSVALFNAVELYWDASGKYVVHKGTGYRINLETGQVDEIEVKGIVVYPEMVSPDRKTIATNANLNGQVRFYDIASGQTTVVSMNGADWGDQELWLNNDQFVVGGRKGLRVINRNGTVEKLIDVDAIGIHNYSSWTVYGHERDGDPIVSTKCLINNERQVINTETGKITSLPAGTEDVVWVNDDTALLRREKTDNTTLDDRGTWLFRTADGADGSLTKLHNLPFERGANALPLPEKNLALFVANDTLYSVNLDGTNLKQLTTTGDFSLFLLGKLKEIDF